MADLGSSKVFGDLTVTGSIVNPALEDALGNKAESSHTHDSMTGVLLASTIEAKVSVTPSSGSLNLDLNLANVFDVNLNQNVTNMSILPINRVGAQSLVLVINHGNSDYMFTWPENVKFPGGESPTLSGANKSDVFLLMSMDGGVSWLGFVSGQEF